MSQLKSIKYKTKPEKINETKSWFLDNINKVEKFLARLIREKREKTHITNTGNEGEGIIAEYE